MQEEPGLGLEHKSWWCFCLHCGGGGSEPGWGSEGMEQIFRVVVLVQACSGDDDHRVLLSAPGNGTQWAAMDSTAGI